MYLVRDAGMRPVSFVACSALDCAPLRVYLSGKKIRGDMLDRIKKFLHLGGAPKEHPVPQPIHIEGVSDTLTPEPDDAELAAQALLELMCKQAAQDNGGSHNTPSTAATPTDQPPEKDAAYYHALADRIRLARQAADQRLRRFLAFCEQELKKPHLPVTGIGSLAQIETELYKRINIVEHEGGELKRRWQHCLATVLVRRMKAQDEEDARNAQKTPTAPAPKPKNK